MNARFGRQLLDRRDEGREGVRHGEQVHLDDAPEQGVVTRDELEALQADPPEWLQVLRAGNLLLANAPGSAPLESSALLGFLPAISEHLLGEPADLESLLASRPSPRNEAAAADVRAIAQSAVATLPSLLADPSATPGPAPPASRRRCCRCS